MGKIIRNKVQGLSWWMKTSLVLLLTVATTVFMYQGWYTPKQAQAAAAAGAWTAIHASAPGNTGATVTSTTAYTAAAGSNRLLLVAVAMEISTAGAMSSVTATYGGVTLTQLNTSRALTGSRGHMYVGYLVNSQIPAGANSVAVTYTTGTTSTVQSLDIKCATYSGIDQTTPINSSNANNSATQTVATNAALAYVVDGITFYAAMNGGTAATPTVTASPAITTNLQNTQNTQQSTSQANSAVHTGAGTYASGGISLTFGGTTSARSALVAASLRPYVAPADSTPCTAGTVSITPNISGTYTSANPTITTVFTDAESAVTTCGYTLNGGTIWTAGVVSGTGPGYTCTANPTSLANATLLTIKMRGSSTGNGATPTESASIQRTVDSSAPTDGTLTVTAGNASNALSWTAATDSGTGIASYILRFASGPTAPANCTLGTAVPGSPFSAATLSTNHTALTNGIQYSYRVCAADNSIPVQTSAGTTGTGTPQAPVNDPTKLGSCTSCHFKNGIEDSTIRNYSGGNFQGSHKPHAAGSLNMACSVCHTTPATQTAADYDHSNRVINMQTVINGAGSYNRTPPIAQSNTFSPSTCNGTTCHGTGSPTWGSNTSSAQCVKCHGVSGTTPAQYTADNKTAAPGYLTTGKDTGGSNLATDAQVGAHDTHLRSLNNYSVDVVCNNCHKNINTTSTTFTGHMNGAGTVVFFGLATTNHAIPTYSAGSCSTNYCHFGKPNNVAYPVGAAVAWNATAYLVGTTADCQKCHLSPPAATGIHAGQAWPGSCITCHPHISSLGVITDQTKHINGLVESTSHVWPYPGATHDSAAGAASYTACTPCHTNWNAVANTYPFARTQAAVTCKTCHKGATFNTAGQGCADCHGTNANGGRPNGGGAVLTAFPNYSGSHTIHVVGQAMTCNDCHFSGGTGTAAHGSSGGILRNNVTFVKLSSPNGKFHATKTTTQATCSSVACHGTAIWGVTKFNCVSCHSVALTRTVGAYAGKSLGAVKDEFALAYGHKKSTRTAVTAADCVVCHLEGVGGTNGTSVTYHKNGTIDLRDPDIQGETPIKNLTDGAFTFGRFSTSFAANSRSSAPAANNIAQVISVKFCLKCHDSKGAENTTARAGGTANMPWGGSTGYAAQTSTTLNGVPVANGTINVFSQFSSGNSSVHPVRKARNRDFPTQGRMVAPYNSFTRVGTAGTLAQGIVMNCFDCHNNYPTLNYLGKTGLLTLRTNAAHGTSGVAASGGMMRGVFYSTNNTLCSACHSGYTVTNNHGAGSAMATSTGRTDEGFANNCMNCHGSKTTAPTTAPARPIAAADFHGSNNRYTGVLYPTINARPVAFIRGWSGTGYHRGRALAGTSGYAAGTAQCGNGTCPTGGAIGDGSTRNYTPGGTY